VTETRRAGWLFVTPIGLLYLLILLAPLSYFLLLSIFKYSAFEMYLFEPTAENYQRLLFDPYYRGVIYRTLRIAATTTVFTLLVAYPLAYFLARYGGPGRGVLMFLVIAPLMSGVIVRTYGWIVLLGAEGTINTALIWLGAIQRPIQILRTEFAVIMAMVHILLPYMVFPLFSAIVAQERNLEQAARTLGASNLRIFLEVTLPLSRPGIVMGSVLVFTLTAGAIVTPQLLGGKEMKVLGILIYDLVLTTLNWPLASAVASLLVLLQFSVIVLYFRGARGRAAA